MAIVNIEFKKIYICSMCKRKFEWGDDCYWYGTLDDIEVLACSKECKEKSGIKDGRR